MGRKLDPMVLCNYFECKIRTRVNTVMVEPSSNGFTT